MQYAYQQRAPFRASVNLDTQEMEPPVLMSTNVAAAIILVIQMPFAPTQRALLVVNASRASPEMAAVVQIQMNARAEVMYATLTPPVAILMEATHVHATAPTRGSVMASLVIVCRKFERHYLLLR